MSYIKNLFFDELSRAMTPTYRPPIRKTTEEHVALVVYQDVELECHFEYEPEIIGASDNQTGVKLEPDYAATLTLTEARVKGVDIMPLLSIDAIDDIERELMP